MRVLVVFGTTRGGTAGLARMIAEAFVARGVPTDLGDASEVDDLAAYDVVIVGGALYNDRWHEDATWLVERHATLLHDRSVWFFSSGPLDSSARAGALAPVDQVRRLARQVEIRGHQTFGGYLERRPGGLLGSLLAWGSPGDFRDETHVQEWVTRIMTALTDTPRVVRGVGGPAGHTDPVRLTDVDDPGLDVFTDL